MLRPLRWMTVSATLALFGVALAADPNRNVIRVALPGGDAGFEAVRQDIEARLEGDNLLRHLDTYTWSGLTLTPTVVSLPVGSGSSWSRIVEARIDREMGDRVIPTAVRYKQVPRVSVEFPLVPLALMTRADSPDTALKLRVHVLSLLSRSSASMVLPRGGRPGEAKVELEMDLRHPAPGVVQKTYTPDLYEYHVLADAEAPADDENPWAAWDHVPTPGQLAWIRVPGYAPARVRRDRSDDRQDLTDRLYWFAPRLHQLGFGKLPEGDPAGMLRFEAKDPGLTGTIVFAWAGQDVPCGAAAAGETVRMPDLYLKALEFARKNRLDPRAVFFALKKTARFKPTLGAEGRHVYQAADLSLKDRLWASAPGQVVAAPVVLASHVYDLQLRFDDPAPEAVTVECADTSTPNSEWTAVAVGGAQGGHPARYSPADGTLTLEAGHLATKPRRWVRVAAPGYEPAVVQLDVAAARATIGTDASRRRVVPLKRLGLVVRLPDQVKAAGLTVRLSRRGADGLDKPAIATPLPTATNGAVVPYPPGTTAADWHGGLVEVWPAGFKPVLARLAGPTVTINRLEPDDGRSVRVVLLNNFARFDVATENLSEAVEAVQAGLCRKLADLSRAAQQGRAIESGRHLVLLPEGAGDAWHDTGPYTPEPPRRGNRPPTRHGESRDALWRHLEERLSAPRAKDAPGLGEHGRVCIVLVTPFQPRRPAAPRPTPWLDHRLAASEVRVVTVVVGQATDLNLGALARAYRGAVVPFPLTDVNDNLDARIRAVAEECWARATRPDPK